MKDHVKDQLISLKAHELSLIRGALTMHYGKTKLLRPNVPAPGVSEDENN